MFCFVLGMINMKSATFHFISLIDSLAVRIRGVHWVLPARCIERLRILESCTRGIALGYPLSLAPQIQLPDLIPKYTEQGDIYYWFVLSTFLISTAGDGNFKVGIVRTLTHDDNIHGTLNRRVRMINEESAVSSGNGEGKEWVFKKILTRTISNMITWTNKII